LCTIHGNDPSWHHAGIAYKTRNQFIENIVGVPASGFGNRPGKATTRDRTYGQLHALFQD